MQRIAIIGAGISGLSCAQLLKDKYAVTLYEKDVKAGGLIKCKVVGGSLFHTCGGHVFNSKMNHVLEWFWSFFDRDAEFVKSERNSIIFMKGGRKIPYPIENYAYLYEDKMLQSFVRDLVEMMQHGQEPAENFEDFLIGRFGTTLYESYFYPYNKKIWQRELSTVPLSWLEGKLPMPTVYEMIYNNIHHVEEKQFVHSTFWYEKNGGSQFIVERFSEGLDIRYCQDISMIEYLPNGKWNVSGEIYDKVIFSGSVKMLPRILKGTDLNVFISKIERLEYHGTTSVFCEIDKNPYSWIYLPSDEYEAHRIICTGNFSSSNNANGKLTSTIEFTNAIKKEEIISQLGKIPLNPKYVTHQYNECTYPIQDMETRDLISNIKDSLEPKGLYLTGRFADWEYYNMDVTMDAAMSTVKKLMESCESC